MGTGYVSGINTDGSIIVGWFDAMFFGDPQTPFIWTPAGGLQELNAYIKNVLGDSIGTSQVYAANVLSPDGRFAAGYGVDNTSFNNFTYRLSLIPATGIHDVTGTGKIKAYPNPTAGPVTIENLKKGILSIRSLDGRIMYKAEVNGKHVMDISKYAPGIYFLTFQSGDLTQTGKIIKN